MNNYSYNITTAPASARSKKRRASGLGSTGYSNASSTVDVSNFVKLKGAASQIVEGTLGATGDVIAYAVGEQESVFPIASENVVGCIKVGDNLSIEEDGTLNALPSGGGASTWEELTGKPTWIGSTKPTYVWTEIGNRPTIPTNTNQLTNGAGYITSSGSITGNAATATKLQTARTIWGKPFDGTANISGDISGTSGIQFDGSRGGKSTAFIWNNANGIHINPNLGSEGIFDIRQNGNVGVGVENPTAKLDVGGNVKSSADIVAYATGDPDPLGLTGYLRSNLVTANDQVGGWSCGVNWTTNYQWLQSHAGRYLVLNPIGNNVGIGTYAPSQKLHVNGNILANGTVSQTSDVRLKNKFNEIDNALERIKNIKPFYYTRRDDIDKIPHLGISAQDVRETFPQLVTMQEDGYYSVDYSSLAVVVAIGGLNELNTKLENENRVLTERLSELENKLNQLLNGATE